MRERTIKVGKPIPLVGVVTEPDRPSQGPAVLILNSGIMHHVGSCRMSVRLARAIAARGLVTLRFDYSGIGDSEPRGGGRPFRELAVAECVEVMDYLQKTRGHDQFLLYGLCSGADASYYAALADTRVVGISQFDPYCYVTARYYLEYYRPVIFDYRRWKAFIGNRFRKVLREGQTRAGEAANHDQFFEVPTYTRVFPPRDEIAAGLRGLVNRGVRIQVNFPRGPLYNYRTQFTDSFGDVPFRDQLELNFFPRANHIITQAEAQAEVLEAVSRWMAQVGLGSPATTAVA